MAMDTAMAMGMEVGIMSSELKKKTVITGASWSFVNQIVIFGIGFILQLALARFLSPSDFGVIAMLGFVLSAGDALAVSGITTSLLRYQRATEEDYSTIFYVNTFLALILYIGIFFSSEFISKFYNSPNLEEIVKVYALVLPVNSLTGVHRTYLTRNLNFKRQTLIQIPSLLVGGGTGLLLGYKGYGAWALVAMYLIQNVTRTILLFFFSGWKPQLIFRRAIFLIHFDYGWKITVITLLKYLFKEIYNILIGKYYTAGILGLYNRAYLLQSVPALTLAVGINKVAFPLFAKLQKDKIALRKVYREIVQQTILLLAPIIGASYFRAEELFFFLLGPNWVEAAVYFKGLCLISLMEAIQNYNQSIIKALGDSGVLMRISFIVKGLTLVGVFLFLENGIKVLIFLQVLFVFMELVVDTYYAGKYIGYNFVLLIKDISVFFAFAFFVGVVMDYFFFFEWNKKSFLSQAGYLIAFYFGYFLLYFGGLLSISNKTIKVLITRMTYLIKRDTVRG